MNPGGFVQKLELSSSFTVADSAIMAASVITELIRNNILTAEILLLLTSSTCNENNLENPVKDVFKAIK